MIRETEALEHKPDGPAFKEPLYLTFSSRLLIFKWQYPVASYACPLSHYTHTYGLTQGFQVYIAEEINGAPTACLNIHLVIKLCAQDFRGRWVEVPVGGGALQMQQ